MGDTDGALRLFRQRLELGGWDEEVYISLYEVAKLTGSTDDWLKAHLARPGRPEALRGTMQRFNEMRAFDLTLALWKKSITAPSADLLFVERWCEEYGVPFEAAIALWWTGEKKIAKVCSSTS